MSDELLIGPMIRYFLNANNMTMKQLGEKLGKTESTVSKWVKGSSVPQAKELSKMTTIFSTDIQTLMFGNKDQDALITELSEKARKLKEIRRRKLLTYTNTLLLEQQREELVKNSDVSFERIRKDLAQVNDLTVQELIRYYSIFPQDDKELNELLLDCKYYLDQGKIKTGAFYPVKERIYKVLMPVGNLGVIGTQTLSGVSKKLKLTEPFIIEAINYYRSTEGMTVETINHIVDFSDLPLEYSDTPEVHNSMIKVTTTY